MGLFLAWMALIAAGLTAYSLLLWKRKQLGSRFQGRLTVLFLLFVLVPAVPLTLFTANLLTRSADMLLLPGIGEALDSSLSTIRLQLEDKGRRFLETHPDPKQWTVPLLAGEGLYSAAVYREAGGRWRPGIRIDSPDCPAAKPWPSPGAGLPPADSSGAAVLLHELAGTPVLTLGQMPDSDTWVTVCYPVPGRIIESKERINRALNVYNALSLLKESILRRNLIWASAVLLVLALSLVAVRAARSLSGRINEPVAALVRGMQAVAGGDFETAVDTRATDEFRFLVDSFNRMVADLKSSRERLVHAEKMTAWREVARRISHEIRNSLTPMSVTLGRIRRRLGETPEGAEMVRTMEEEMESLRRMASEFSEFSSLPRPEQAPVRPEDAAASAVRLVESAFPRIRFVLETEPQLPALAADFEQIKRALHNVLKNAAEASVDGGSVTIRAAMDRSGDGSVFFEIEDRGKGMDPDTLKRLFTPYYTTKQNGTGLGLAIVEKIVVDHGGSVSVRSEPGRGTFMILRLPPAAPAVAEA
ncbi:HAMP domain-containing protein [bacterium]|nr:HAMP domain-containing protein [bacterium]